MELTVVIEANEVTDEILEGAIDIYESYFVDDRSMDWEDFIGTLEGIELKDGTYLDFGPEFQTPAQAKIKRHVLKYRNTG